MKHFHASIYQPHYDKETLRYGVAYLIAPEAQPKDLPQKVSLDAQRAAIGQAALDCQCIIVKEFIETDTSVAMAQRPAFQEVMEFAKEYRHSFLFHAGEDYLALRNNDWYFFRALTDGHGLSRRSVATA